uniref:Uncharacterized protein n=1 Tax=Cacopsylla melanoneura TaxID=428564 RepID=A0A8D8R5Q6_9HEMI
MKASLPITLLLSGVMLGATIFKSNKLEHFIVNIIYYLITSPTVSLLVWLIHSYRVQSPRRNKHFHFAFNRESMKPHIGTVLLKSSHSVFLMSSHYIQFPRREEHFHIAFKIYEVSYIPIGISTGFSNLKV